MPKDGPYHADVPEFYLPAKEEVYNNMEALIYHFKIVMGETTVPKGEVYHSVEGGNGEVGYYLVSDGGRTPLLLAAENDNAECLKILLEKGANINERHHNKREQSLIQSMLILRLRYIWRWKTTTLK